MATHAITGRPPIIIDIPESLPPNRRGRPSRSDAALLGGHIIEIATEAFLADGYGDTSIEAVARRAGVSKRTFYARFPDKAALLLAVVRHVLERLRPAHVDMLFEAGPLELVLPRVARAILTAAMDPLALGLHRITVAESARFPEVASAMATEGGGAEAIERISALLDSDPAKRPPPGMTAFAAAQFLQMVVAIPQQRAMGRGTPMAPDELAAWADLTVRLFLDGWRGG